MKFVDLQVNIFGPLTAPYFTQRDQRIRRMTIGVTVERPFLDPHPTDNPDEYSPELDPFRGDDELVDDQEEYTEIDIDEEIVELDDDFYNPSVEDYEEPSDAGDREHY